jgi:hypothetical protein
VAAGVKWFPLENAFFWVVEKKKVLLDSQQFFGKKNGNFFLLAHMYEP